MMKVKLLNDGGFGYAISGINIHKTMTAKKHRYIDGAITVSRHELIKAGADEAILGPLVALTFTDGEFEVFDEK